MDLLIHLKNGAHTTIWPPVMVIGVLPVSLNVALLEKTNRIQQQVLVQMALIIKDSCINCDVCEDKCPNDAIYMGEDIFEINPSHCTECVGHFDEPQCQVFCPVDCIIKDPNNVESKSELQDKYASLNAEISA